MDHLGLVSGMFDELGMGDIWIRPPNKTRRHET